MSKYIRWQAIIALLGIILLGSLLGYLAFHRTTVTVPDVGGTYTEGLAGNPQYINPILCQYNEVDRDLVSLIFSGLTKINEKFEIVPDLATDWEVSPDGLTYTFHLRRDVQWHDGAPFTADDVAFTIAAMQHPDFQGVPYLAELWQGVTVDKIDEYTISFTLAEPYPPFLDYTTVGLLPAHLLAKVPPELLPKSQFNVKPIGTGRFAVTEVAADHITLQANPQYYGPRPYLSQVEFKFYPNYNAVFNAYQRGEIDGISRVLPADRPQAVANEQLQLFSARLSGYTLIYFKLDNPNTPFFADKRVRQALLYGLDRQQLIDEVLDGQGLVADSPIMPNSWAYYDGIKRYTHDPAQARALLDEAGWTDSDGDGVRDKGGVRLEFALLTNDDPTRVQLIEAIARQWATIGVDAKPQSVGVSGLVRDFLRPRRFEAILTQWQELPPDPDLYPLWHQTQIENGQNYAGFDHRRASEILEMARQTTDQVQRQELYRQFQEIFADEVPAILLYYPIYSYAVDKKVHNVQLAPLLDGSDRFRNINQWYIVTKRVIVSEAEQIRVDKSSK